MYECDKCGYVSNKKCNLEKHKQRKNPCGRAYIGITNINNKNDGINDDSPNNNAQCRNYNVDGQNDNRTNTFDNVCSKCKKHLKSKRNVLRHMKICKGVDNLTCYKCMKVFASRYGRNNHLTYVKCDVKQLISENEPCDTMYNVEGDLINTINNITNNTMNNNINNHIHINCFGKED